VNFFTYSWRVLEGVVQEMSFRGFLSVSSGSVFEGVLQDVLKRFSRGILRVVLNVGY
jgi:hypothetical protein